MDPLAPFVGREQELEILRAAVKDATKIATARGLRSAQLRGDAAAPSSGQL